LPRSRPQSAQVQICQPFFIDLIKLALAHCSGLEKPFHRYHQIVDEIECVKN